MFIARTQISPPAPFGGAELMLSSINLDTFRSSERRMILAMPQSINISLLRSGELLVSGFQTCGDRVRLP